jgi:hypothetical protein
MIIHTCNCDQYVLWYGVEHHCVEQGTKQVRVG